MLKRRQILISAIALLGLGLSGCQTTRDVQPIALYDTHSHFFSNDEARYPLNTAGSPEGAENLRARILANPSTPENILRLWSENHVEGGVGVQYNSAYKTDNSYTLDSSDNYPDRISAVIILDARLTDTPIRLREFVEQRGVTGLRLTGYPDSAGNYPWMEAESAQATWAEANRLGIAIVLMYLPTQPSPEALRRIAALAQRYPNVHIVLDHIGWPLGNADANYGILPEHVALAHHRNVYFKLTSINLDQLDSAGIDTAQFVRRAVDTFGADHMMWGSDYGNTRGQFPEMVSRAVAATSLLSPTERRQLLHDTGARIFRRRAASRP
jgi:L-fuconolactonase